MQLKIRIVDAKFLQFTYEGHILVLVPTGGDLLYYTDGGAAAPGFVIIVIAMLKAELGPGIDYRL